MLSKIAPPVLVALVIAGCGSQTLQSTAASPAGPTTGASGGAPSASARHVARSTTGRPPGKPAAAQVYLAKRSLRPESDNEGPGKPVPGRAPTWSYHVVLTRGSASAGSRGGAATTARVTLRGGRVCWQFAHLPTDSATAVTPATIHVGAHGKPGPEVVVFGARFSPRGCIVVRPLVVNSIAAAPSLYYLRVAGRAYRGGVARAQL